MINEKLLKTPVQNIINSLDSGWKDATYSSQFASYSGNTPVKYRKINNVVQVVGQVKTTSTIASGSSGTICTLPVGFRPVFTTFAIAQGSGINRWFVQVSSDGNVTAQRYGASAQTEINTSQWLAFSIMFIAN